MPLELLQTGSMVFTGLGIVLLVHRFILAIALVYELSDLGIEGFYISELA